MLGNQLSKTLTIKTPLYISSHFDIPAATTVSGVLRAPLGRSFRAAKNAGPTVEYTAGLSSTAFVANSLEREREREKRVAMVRVDPVSGEEVDDVAEVLRGNWRFEKIRRGF